MVLKLLRILSNLLTSSRIKVHDLKLYLNFVSRGVDISSCIYTYFFLRNVVFILMKYDNKKSMLYIVGKM
jgi:hypothetical protein